MGNAASRVVATFGGGNGIGAACCRLLAERGWRVAVVDLDENAAAGVASDIGGSAYAVDIQDRSAIEQVAVGIERDLGPLYGLVVSSGAFQERCAPSELSDEVWHRMVNTNLVGAFNACQIFGTRMATRGAGSIVTVASHSGHVPTPMFAYAATKAAVLNATKGLAVTWARSGVRVNSVSPGHVLVERKKKARPGRYAADLLSHIALGRHIEPGEVAEGVEFLISDRSSAITGTDLLIDAGLVAAGSFEMFGGVPPAP
jgi:NAD(P)-dependent dehydrogenase (short-subunit alcohol dehydrogenase family)